MSACFGLWPAPLIVINNDKFEIFERPLYIGVLEIIILIQSYKALMNTVDGAVPFSNTLLVKSDCIFSTKCFIRFCLFQYVLSL